MTVYVDELQDYRPGYIKPGTRRFGTRWCHLTADDELELHRFAIRLGLRSEWFQPHFRPEFCHYDLTPGMRAKAVELGAIEVKALERARELVKRWSEASGVQGEDHERL